jgi:predicted MFS family arabinose efflux permease
MALLALALLYLMLALSSVHFATLIAATGIWGLLNHLGLNILIASLNACSSTHRGAVLGLYSGITYVCMSVGTVAFSALYQWTDFKLICAIAAALCLIGTTISMYNRKARHDNID